MNHLSTFIFKPSKTIIFTNKTRNNINSIEPYKYKAHSLSKQQKIFNTISPVRPFNRFIRQKIYGTGEDPSSAFIHFMNKDGEKPYKKKISPIITEGIKKAIKNNKWSLGTTYITNKKEYLPKIDPYKEYCFTSRDKDKINTNKFLMTYLPTDHISLRNPELSKTIDVDKKRNNSYMSMKKKFHFNIESESYWKPYINVDNNNFNRSSVKYNIINNKENKISGKKDISIIEKTVNNKKKGVTEFFHLQRDYEPNFSPKFSKFFKEYRSGFMKYKGLFTDLYDSYNKNGNIYQPFSINNNNNIIGKKAKNF